jgi:lipopolysaccharide transport system permease protein
MPWGYRHLTSVGNSVRIRRVTEKQETTIYSAEASNRFLFSHLRDIVHDLPQAHELGLRLFKRNLKALYRQSLLGFGWALLPPLATAALWILLRGGDVVRMEETGVPYPVFVLTGTLLWQVFSEAISAPLTQVTENRAMLSKINIPREGLLLSGVYQLLFNIGIKILLLAVIYLFFHQTVSLPGLLFVPAGLLAISLAGFSIGLALTPLGMLYQDINRGVAVLLPFFMYLTPVVYPPPQAGLLRLLMQWNPLAVLITQTRNGFTAQPLSELASFWAFTLAFALLFTISLVVYRLAMPMIIERMGS